MFHLPLIFSFESCPCTARREQETESKAEIAMAAKNKKKAKRSRSSSTRAPFRQACFSDKYSLTDQILGCGSNGKVVNCVEKASKVRYAMLILIELGVISDEMAYLVENLSPH